MKRPELTIKLRLAVTMAVTCLLLVIVGLAGLRALEHSNQSLNEAYEYELKPTQTLARAMELVQDNRIALMSAHANPQSAIIESTAGKISKNNASVDEMLKKLAGDKGLPADQQKIMTALKQDREALVGALGKDMDALKAGDMSTAKMLEMMKVAPAFAPVQSDIRKLIDLKVKEAGAHYQDALARYNEYRLITWGSIALGLLITAVLGFFVLRSIMRSLNSAVFVADRISQGILNNHIVIKSNDEAGRLLRALRTMDERLSTIVGSVREGSESVGSAARQISQGNDDLSQRTQEQASSLEETASSMEEMTSTVRQNAENARQASQLASGAREQAEKGGAVVSNAVTAMAEINTSSEKIADIIGVIDEIAFQTNLLALNAAVEAARAGEQGRGFAVVATEVRNLAQRSASAAKEIKDLIQDSVGKVKTGSELVDESGRALTEIVDSVKKVTDIVAEIAAASQEQSAGIDQVNGAVMQMDEVTQQNAALVEEAASASRAMEEQAAGLNQQMAFFRRSHGNADAAETANKPRPTATPDIAVAIEPDQPAPRVPAPAARVNGSRPAGAGVSAAATASEEKDVWQEF